MKLQLNKSLIGKAFSFTIDSKAFIFTMQKVSSASNTSSASDKLFMLCSNATSLSILGFTNDTVVAVEFADCKVSGAGVVGVIPDDLIGIAKNRGELEFKIAASGVCSFRALKSKYNGSITAMPSTEDNIATATALLAGSDKEAVVSLTPDVLNVVKEGLAMTGVRDVFEETTLPSYISIANGSIEVSTFDNHHFGLYRSKLKTDAKLRIAMTSTMFSTIDKLTSGTKVRFSLGNSSLKAEGMDFIAVLPMLQGDDRKFSMLTDFIKGINGVSARTTVDVTRLLDVMSNLYSLYQVNATFGLVLKSENPAMTFQVNTAKGKASDVISIKPTPIKENVISVDVEPRVFKDVVSLLKGRGEVTLMVKVENFLKFSTTLASGAKVDLVCSLH